MQIKLADSAGFCFGVDRAVNMVYDLLKENQKVCTLGPIIHNANLVEELKNKGVQIVHNPIEAPKDSTVVIRSHGVPKTVFDEIKTLDVRVADATCPFVAKIHKLVKENSEKGFMVMIAGDSEHPEVEGIKGYCSGLVFIFDSLSELKDITEKHQELTKKDVCVVSQTTFNTEVWDECYNFIKKVYTKAIIFDTICNATSIRQQEARELAENSDCMIVIGSKESSNTAKLLAVCLKFCPSFLAEGPEDLPIEMIKNANKVGVTAGASTPAWIIKEVLKTMADFNEAENDDISFEEALEQSFKTLENDEIVKGIVMAIAPNEVQIDVGTKHTGFIPLAELTDDSAVKPEQILKIGDELDLVVLRVNDQEGTVMLSKKRFDAIKGWKDIVAASEDGSVLDGTVTDVIKGGVLAVTNGVKVFIPASQSGVSRNGNLEDILHNKVSFKIIDINTQRKRAVGSIRAVLKEEKKEAAEKFWSEVEIGREYTGTVKSLTSYGAFVDLGGIDGMIHISELSWTRIKQPSEVVNVGDVVKVYVKDLNTETHKISLGYKKPEDNPWEIFKTKYNIGDIIDAKIVSFMPFGAFAQIIPGVDGLIHISQISDEHIAKPQDVLKMNDIVKVKITNIELDKKRISLSMKEANEGEQPAEAAADTENVND